MAHFLNGRLVKGSSTSIALDRPICHVMTRDQGVVVVTLSDLKALFFVKDLEGNRAYRDQQVIGSTDAPPEQSGYKSPSATESSSSHSHRPTRGHASFFTCSPPILIATIFVSL